MNGSWRWMRAARALAITGVLASAMALTGTASASDGTAVIGHVKTVSGQAWVGPRDSAVAAVVGAPVRVGDTMRTGPAGSLGVTLRDNTVLSFGPKTEFTVDEFLFEPDRGEARLATSITRGTLNFISGLIAKMRPEAQTVRTPTGTIGVRGTHFLVKIDEPEQ